MKSEIQKKLELFAENALDIRNDFIWQNILLKKMAALLYALDNRRIDITAIKDSHKLIKNSVGAFSAFRGNMALCVAAMLSQKNRVDLFDRTMTVYKMLKDARFRGSDYLVVAAFEIAVQAKPEEFEKVVTRTREFYDGMKSKGFFRTGEDDYIFSAMLGLSDIDVKTGTERIEQLYQRFRPEFWSGNSVQALAQVLVLSGDCESSIKRILTLRDAMKAKKIRLDKSYTLPSLGVLALLPIEIDVLVRDIDESVRFLQAQKGFNPWSVSKQVVLLFATAIVVSVYAGDIENGSIAAISTSIASIIIAQQAAIIAAMSSSAAASAAASG
jgi:hypothetical protein